MNAMKHTFFLLFLFTTLKLLAVPATPYPILHQQPDGSDVELYLHGDETTHCLADKLGYVVSKDVDGFFKYLNKDYSVSVRRVGDLVAGATLSVTEWAGSEKVLQARKKQPERPKRLAGYPKEGNPPGLVILVNFADCEFITPDAKNAFSRMLNEPGYAENEATGSALDYFRACSQGKFSPRFDVVGPYTLPGKIEDYGYNNKWNGGDGNPRQMIVDACAAADEAGLDFKIYDTDEDDIIDNVFVYYAGYNEAEGAPENTVWPHRSVVSESMVQGSVVFDGKTVYDYACTSELNGYTGTTMAAIGTFCHEFGHVLGLPDYYHTQDSKVKTLMYWDIMDRGSYLNNSKTPPVYSSYDRFFLGWLTPRELSKPEYVALEPLTQADSIVDTSNQALLVAATEHNLDGGNPDPKEFFMIEYRKKTGWDSYLPAEGILFWHIDYNARVWRMNTVNDYKETHNGATDHMRVYIEPRTSTKNYNPTTFTSGDFEPVLWNGTSLGKPITDINVLEQKAYFTFMGGEPLDAPVIVDSLTTHYATGFTISWSKVWEEESEVNGYYVVVKNKEGVEEERIWTTDTVMTVSGLDYDKEYTYLVETAYKNGSYEVRQPSDERIFVSEKLNKKLEVSYSPGNKVLVIYKDNKDAVVGVYNMEGRKLYSINEKNNLVYLDLADYLPGQPLLLQCEKKSAKFVVP